MNGRIACVLGLLLCISSATASAQDKGDTGLAISIPTAVGVIWHPSDRVAVRPDFTFGLTESDGEGSIPDISSRSFTFGIGALLYTHRWDELRTYVSPRFTYSHSVSDIDNSLDGTDSTLAAWGLSGSLGAQYSLGERFSVFAEVGLLYSSQRSESSSFGGVTDRTTWTFGTRTTAGGILYF
jgi:hypothetical protein